MLARVISSGLRGIDAYPLGVEVDISQGLPSFDIVGLPDTSVRESRERVKSALRNSGFKFPLRRVIVSLTPASIRKEGPALDLPIALGILAACGEISSSGDSEYSAIGELSLDGRVHSVAGVVPIVRQLLLSTHVVLVPSTQYSDLSMLDTQRLVPVASLTEAVQVIKEGRKSHSVHVSSATSEAKSEAYVDLASVVGLNSAKRVLEIAAVGGHHLLLMGQPGSGKSLLARCLAGILPDLSVDETLDVISIYSAVGNSQFPTGRPFRSPHHSTTASALIGGGSNLRPGEATLAHHGVLFMDELPEFRRDCLEALRQPLDEGKLTVGRAQSSYTFPCLFQLVATANLCPCGNAGNGGRARRCTCSERAVSSYLAKISGPVLDRIDLSIGLSNQSLRLSTNTENSILVKSRVEKCRRLQYDRNKDTLNSHLSHDDLKRFGIEPGALRLLTMVAIENDFSMRSQLKVLRIARTIADMGGDSSIRVAHIQEAMAYRSDPLTVARGRMA